MFRLVGHLRRVILDVPNGLPEADARLLILVFGRFERRELVIWSKYPNGWLFLGLDELPEDQTRLDPVCYHVVLVRAETAGGRNLTALGLRFPVVGC